MTSTLQLKALCRDLAKWVFLLLSGPLWSLYHHVLFLFCGSRVSRGVCECVVQVLESFKMIESYAILRLGCNVFGEEFVSLVGAFMFFSSPGKDFHPS